MSGLTYLIGIEKDRDRDTTIIIHISSVKTKIYTVEGASIFSSSLIHFFILSINEYKEYYVQKHKDIKNLNKYQKIYQFGAFSDSVSHLRLTRMLWHCKSITTYL